MRRVASISSVPGGTWTSRSLIFSVTSFSSAIWFYREPPLHCPSERFGGFVRTAPIQIIFEFVAPLLNDADGWQRSTIAERPKGPPEHVSAKTSTHVIY